MKHVDAKYKYLLAVSGGSDSMAMLDMFANARLNFDVLTINHGLRTTAQRDCQLVEQYCNTRQIKCIVHNMDVNAYCKEHGVSVETGARILRRQLFNKLSSDYHFVCLAHNKDDNAETILMHVLRGSGIKGAEGIREQDGKYLRPVLSYTKAQLVKYCQQHNVPYCEDETNSDTAYRRNFIRHKVMPLLQQYNSGVVDNIVRFGQNAAADNAVLDKLADISQVKFTHNGASIPINLLQNNDAIAYRIVDKVLTQLGYWHDIERVHYLDIIGLANNCGGKTINLPFGLQAVNDYQYVTILIQGDSSKPCTYSYPFGKGKFVIAGGILVIEDVAPDDSQTTGKVLVVDAHKIPDNAVIRTPIKGDMFTKFGGGTKPLSRYFIDKKISRRDRELVPIVATDNIVLAVVGVEISQSVRTDSNTSVKYYLYITKEGQH